MRFSVSAIDVDILTKDLLLRDLQDAVAERRKKRVVFCNVSTIVESQRNAGLRSAVCRSEIVSPDGMPLVWLARLQGAGTVERVDGPSFMKLAMQHGVERGWRHYLYGSTDLVLQVLRSRLESEIPGLAIAGSFAPPFRDLSEAESQATVERINETAPDLVWVGLGMPRQELWMAELQNLLAAPVLLGVGAAFDFHAGVKKRAPVWMQRSGLEWAHRLAQEPRRLGRRYVLGNARFVSLVAVDTAQTRLRRLRKAS